MKLFGIVLYLAGLVSIQGNTATTQTPFVSEKEVTSTPSIEIPQGNTATTQKPFVSTTDIVSAPLTAITQENTTSEVGKSTIEVSTFASVATTLQCPTCHPCTETTQGGVVYPKYVVNSLILGMIVMFVLALCLILFLIWKVKQKPTKYSEQTGQAMVVGKDHMDDRLQMQTSSRNNHVYEDPVCNLARFDKEEDHYALNIP